MQGELSVNSRKAISAAPLMAGMLCLLVYLPALTCGFINFDDPFYVTKNPLIMHLDSGLLARVFTKPYLGGWIPLTHLSMALDRALWHENPFGYHLTNILLHAANTALVVLIADRLCRKKFAAAVAPAAPNWLYPLMLVLAGLLFGIHPLRVESVAWAAERKDVLSMFFGMWAVVVYLRRSAHAQGAGALGFLRERRYWLVVLLYTLSLLAKATLVTLPVALLVVDHCPLGRWRREGKAVVILEKLPLLALAVAAALITANAMAISSRSLAEIGLSSRLLVAAGAIARYLQLTVVPAGISPVYFHPGNVTLGAGYSLALGVVVSLSVAAVATSRRWPAALAAWSVFLLALAPVSGVFQNGPQELAARFTYFPSMALWVLAAGGGLSLWSRLPPKGAGRRILPLALALPLGSLAAVTVRDVGFWRDDVTMWSRVIDLAPHRFGKAYFERAFSLAASGRNAEALADASEALAIAERKGYRQIHENHAQVAEILGSLGDVTGAIDAYGRAIEASGEPWREQYRWERARLLDVAGQRRRPEEVRQRVGGGEAAP